MNPLTTHSARTDVPVAAPTRATPRAMAVIAVAATASGALWLLASPALGIDLEVTMGDATRTIGLGSVLLSTLVAAAAGWATLALLHRRAKGRTIWTWCAVVVALLSLVSPLTMASSLPAAATLAAMHVAVAAIVVPGLLRASGSRR